MDKVEISLIEIPELLVLEIGGVNLLQQRIDFRLRQATTRVLFAHQLAKRLDSAVFGKHVEGEAGDFLAFIGQLSLKQLLLLAVDDSLLLHHLQVLLHLLSLIFAPAVGHSTGCPIACDEIGDGDKQNDVDGNGYIREIERPRHAEVVFNSADRLIIGIEGIGSEVILAIIQT